MKHRFAAPVAGAATAILLLAACSDDGPTTLAKGEDVSFVDSAPWFGDQTMDITAVEEDGEVTGEARFSPAGLALALECADTDTDGLVILGGEATAAAGDTAVGDRVAVIIREGDPDAAILYFELPLPEGAVAAGSCRELLASIPQDQLTGDDPLADLADVAEGDDIETG
jgi:hypothetical protein